MSPYLNKLLLFMSGTITGIFSYHLVAISQLHFENESISTAAITSNKAVSPTAPPIDDHLDSHESFSADQRSPAREESPEYSDDSEISLQEYDSKLDTASVSKRVTQFNLNHGRDGFTPPVTTADSMTQEDIAAVLNELGWASENELINLLANIDLSNDPKLAATLRVNVIEGTYSDKPELRRKATLLMALSGDLYGASDVQQRMLEIGWTEENPEVLLAMVENMDLTQAKPRVRYETLEIFSDRLNTFDDPRVRQAALFQYTNWQHDAALLDEAFQKGLRDPAPEMVVATIYAMGTKAPVSSHNKPTLMDMLVDKNQSVDIRVAAAEVLSREVLSDEEFAMVQFVLKNR
jgi:hypothetical protein